MKKDDIDDIHFDGETFDPEQDQERLTKQLRKVHNAIRIRDLRKKKFGGHSVEHRRVDGGLWEYRLIR